MKQRKQITLSPDGDALLAILANKYGLSLSSMMELLIREGAESRHVALPIVEVQTKKELTAQFKRVSKKQPVTQ